ncbi:MAG TPA: Rieske (2Fe-2S) protein [Verrucomicrobiae bacterium]|jgi:nitrite reductase/ring-hydroxylating ferredoxin subunit|nr:Rieske (2Fe-2S) protein [Verrucomicrobiae bacterium]
MRATVYLSIFFLSLFLIGAALRRYQFFRDKRRMERESKAGGRVVARVAEMEPGSVKKFGLICQKYRIDAFLINYDGTFHAYVNRCRHMTTPLDFVRYQFFTEDRRHLICMTHGALYDPASGLCVEGPCKGQSLYALPVRVDGDEVLVGCPAGDLSELADL